MHRIRTFENIATALVIAVCVCMFVATAIVTFGHVPPVFNQGLRLNQFLHLGFLIGLPVVLALLSASYFNWRAARVRRPILLVCTVLLTLECALYGFDKLVVSTKGSPLPEATYSIRAGGGTTFLDQANAMSPYGFRWPRVEPKQVSGERVLMLGNSYVVGSGTTFATNYPQLLEKDLRALQPGRDVSVFSAGVNAYGIVEEHVLYDYLLQQGYTFNTVVVNFYLGGDQTNDIRGTTRIAISGRAQRLHNNRFLRYFYPLDTTLFRFMIYLKVAFVDNWAGAAAEGGASGRVAARTLTDASCIKSPDFDAFSRERTTYNYGAGAQQRIDMDYNWVGIAALAQDAQQHGSKFVLVLLPDYNSLLPINTGRFRGVPMDWDWIRTYLKQHAQGRYPVFDFSESFQDRSDLFRCNDTHWNDKGNVYAAQVAADYFVNAANKQ